MMQETIFSPQRQAHLFSMGVLAVITIGTIGLITACFVALWLAFEAVTLLLTSILECSQVLTSEYMSADPFVKLLILASLAYLAYRLIRHIRRNR